MTPDAALRMAVYQEGQRAHRSKTPCPYTDWRARTWKKGHDDAATHYRQRVQDTAEAAVPEEAHDTLRAHVDRLNAALDEARAEASVAYLAFEQVTAERDKLRAALQLAVRQNEHDMVLTGEELRACRAALAKAGVEQL
jgi:hypothetical protein